MSEDLTTTSGVNETPAAGEGAQQQATPPVAEQVKGDRQEELNLSERERAFLAGLKDEREKRQQLEKELELLRANAGQGQPPQAHPVPPITPATQQPASELDPFAGLEEDDIVTVKDIKAKFMPAVMSVVQQIAGAVAIQQRAQQFSDVTDDDIRAYVPRIVQEDPAIGQIIQMLPPPAQFIIAQTLTRYAKRASTPPAQQQVAQPAQQSQGDPLHEIARAILANSTKPASPGAGGGGAMDDVVSMLRNMTPEQWEQYRQQKRKAMGL